MSLGSYSNEGISADRRGDWRQAVKRPAQKRTYTMADARKAGRDGLRAFALTRLIARWRREAATDLNGKTARAGTWGIMSEKSPTLRRCADELERVLAP